MTVIRIEEQIVANQPAFFVSFDHGIRYTIQISDPFSDISGQEEDLEWYFEEYLAFPFVENVRARHAADSIRGYGEALFTQAFADPGALATYRQSIQQGGLHSIQIEIVGSPSFQRLHWEALYDPELRVYLALHAPFIRQNSVPQTFPATMRPSPTINILVVVARPNGPRDVGYRTISRPLVDSLKKTQQRVEVTLLRPGTYAALDAHLEKVTRERGIGYYHVIHFDVHGGLMTYEQFQHGGQPDRYLYRGRFGRSDIEKYAGEKAYLFLEGEGDEQQADPVEASEMAQLLLRHQIPIAILNACQSGKYIGEQETSLLQYPETDRRKSEIPVQPSTPLHRNYSTSSIPTRSSGNALGSHLIQAGVQTVLAMGYSVTVSAVEMLMPVLYQELFADKSLATALCLARQALANRKERRAYFNQKIELEDWVLPLVYQNKDVPFAHQPFTPEQETAFYKREAEQYAPTQPTYGFVGRDIDILHIEKRLLTKRNILLVQGMGGAGKTTLLQHLAAWWQRTGLVRQVFYFGYDERAWSRQQLMRTIAQKLLGREEFALFQSRSQDAQQIQLTQLLRSTPHLIILDNLESIIGTPLAIRHTLSKKEQSFLHSFLTELAAGQTLVVLGSRSAEAWLAQGTFAENRYELAGLDPESASTLCERILERHKATRYQKDKDLPSLLKLLDGFPLALEVILANLAQQTPTQVLAALQTGAVTLKTGASDKRTENILLCIDYSHRNLSPDAQQLLLCFAPFTSVIWQDILDKYATILKQQPSLAHLPFDSLPKVLHEAEKWGLLSPDPDIPQFLHMQPTLAYFLRNQLSSEEQKERRIAIEKAFYEHYYEMSKSIDALIRSKQANEQQVGLLLARFEYENLFAALRFALRENAFVFPIYSVLDEYLQRSQDHQHGQELDRMVLDSLETLSPEGLAGPRGEEFVRVLGTSANRQLDLKQYEAATTLYRKVLQVIEAISLEEKERRMFQSVVYHQLGMVAQEQRKWEEAEGYYREALQIKIEYKDRYEQAAGTYHQLGMVAQKQRKWEEAEGYYREALQIKIEYKARYEQAKTYHQLGRVAHEQRKWEEAEGYYREALQIFVEYKVWYEQGSTYHNLGAVAQEQRKWEEAEGYYREALQIYIEYKARYEQAGTYHQLGRVAQEQRKWEEAEGYYREALQIKIEYKARYEQAGTYHQLGMVAQEQRKWEEAEGYYREALQIFIEYKDNESGGIVFRSLARLWRACNDSGLIGRVASIVGMTPEEVEELFQEGQADTSGEDEEESGSSPS